MTELAYMVREDWGQHGTAMVPQSAVIRAWLGEPPYVFGTWDMVKYQSSNSADREFVVFVAPRAADRTIANLSELGQLCGSDERLERALVILHPYKEHDRDLLREVVGAKSVERIFVIVWSPRDAVRMWLDGMGALNLYTDSTVAGPDPVQLEAANCWVSEQCNVLSSGNGKDAVVQILRVLTSAGYAMYADTWVRAFFAAGGEFDEAEKVATLIKEMQ